MADDRFNSAAEEGRLNQEEAKSGQAMSPGEVASHFQEPTPAPEPVVKAPQTEEELAAWQKAQDESEDLYKIAARVKNLAREGNKVLTPQGEALCNTYVHVLKSLYEWSNKIPDEALRKELKDFIRSKEDMPGSYISAMMAGVKK